MVKIKPVFNSMAQGAAFVGIQDILRSIYESFIA
jgi:hypothetical protein